MKYENDLPHITRIRKFLKVVLTNEYHLCLHTEVESSSNIRIHTAYVISPFAIKIELKITLYFGGCTARRWLIGGKLLAAMIIGW